MVSVESVTDGSTGLLDAPACSTGGHAIIEIVLLVAAGMLAVWISWLVSILK
jgi:hypothetical protein